MKNFRLPFLALAALILALAGCSDEPGQGVPEAPPAPAPKAAPEATASGQPPAASRPAALPPLALLRLEPSGDLNRFSQVAAMFNQPMVALGDYGRVPEGVLELSPDLPGRRLWLNQYTLAFIPDKPWSGSLNLKITLRPDRLTALSGEKLPAKEITAEARLPRLAPLSSRLTDDEPKDTEEALKPVWRVVFNQPAESASLENRAFYVWQENGSERRRPARPRGSGKEFSFFAQEKLPRDTDYKLILEAGAVSLAGPEPAPELLLAKGSTFGPLLVSFTSSDEALKSIDPSWGPPNLYFSNPVDMSELAPLIRLEPETDMSPLLKRYAKASSEENVEGDAEESAGDEEERDVSPVRQDLYWSLQLKGDTDYKVIIDSAARDVFGQSLGAGPPLTFHTRSYRSYLDFKEEYGLLETASPPRLSLKVSNLPWAHIEGFALGADEAIPLLARAYDGGRYIYGEGAERSIEGLKPSGRLTIKVPDGAKDGRRTLPLNLAELFGESRLGHLLVIRGSWLNNEGGRSKTWAVTQISDLGLTVKTGAESGLIWTTDLARAKAWPGVELEARDAGNEILWSGRSDAEGLARLPGLEELFNGPDPSGRLFIVARAGGQMALWHSGWNDGLENWRWNLGGYMNPDRAINEGQNWLLSALPIYRPGETAKFKLIARRGLGDLLREETDELLLEIRDPLGETRERFEAAVGRFGTLSHEFALPADAHLGDWTVWAGHEEKGGSELAYAGSFKVMTYRPPALEIKIEGRPQAALAGDRVELTAQADYHFGSPAAGRPVKYEVTAAPAWFRLPGPYADFRITDGQSRRGEEDDGPEEYGEPTETAASGEGTLDKAGAFKFAVNLTAPADRAPRPRSYAAHLTVTDVDGRTVSTSENFLVHPAALYAGLSVPLLGQAGESHKINLIAVDAEGRPAAGQKLEVALFRRSWQSVRRKTPGSAYEYVSRLVDEKAAEAELISGETPIVWPVTPDKPGYYWAQVSLKDKDGRQAQAADYFYAAGPGSAGWRPGRDDEPLLLVPDKQSYQPGDTARIMVQSPFDQGEGLLTVERSGVRSSRTFKIESQTPVLEAPIAEGDAPNLFVSVLLARGRVAEQPDRTNLDFGKPVLRAGYAELKIPSKADLLTVKVEAEPAEVGPGEETTLRLSVTDHQGRPFSEAEAALIVADAAVIQLAGDAGYRPETKYHRDYPLLVQTASNIFSLISRENFGLKGGDPGGGGGLSAALADEVRRRFASLAHFDPALSLDKNGRAEVRVKMPENLTTFKVYAVATGLGRKTGTGQASVLVTRDLLVRQALPNQAAAGDEFLASVVVSDRGTGGGQATVSLEGENFTLLEEAAAKTVAVEPGQSRETTFKVRTDRAGTAKFLFRVAMGKDRDQAEFALPVVWPSPLAVQGAFERLTGPLAMALARPEGADPDRGGLEVEMAPTLLGVLRGPLDWLLAYPHGCVEQTTSRAFANLMTLTLADRLGTSPEQAELARSRVKAVLAQLAQWETGGGYNYWPGEFGWSSRSVFLTAYVLDFILAAKDAGLEPADEDLAPRLAKFLAEALKEDGNSRRLNSQWLKLSPEAELDSKLYALALLARLGTPEAQAAIEVFYPQREKMTLFQLTQLLRAVAASSGGPDRTEQKKTLLKMMEKKHFTFTPAGVELADSRPGSRETWSSQKRTMALAVTALAEAAPENPLLPGLVRRLLGGATPQGHFGSTQENVAVLRAFAAAAAALEPTPPDLTATARLTAAARPPAPPADGWLADGRLADMADGLLAIGPLADGRFQGFTAKPLIASVPLSALPPDGPKLQFDLQGQGGLWAAVRLRSAPLKPDFSDWSNGGFFLSRDYTVVAPQAGPAGAGRFKRGQTVRTTVSLVVPEPRYNVVLEDFIPAGFEPVNFSLADADQTLLNLIEPKDEDEGERRRYWYNHQEIWPGRVAVYADFLAPGVYTFSYLVRAATPGLFQAPGPQAEEMYEPENAGRGAGGLITVEE